MDRLENLEGEVKNLNAAELKAFREWFASFDAEVWDNQIEADSMNGKLRSIVERALREHEAGRSSRL